MQHVQLDLLPNTSMQTIIEGDCLEVMRSMEPDSITHIVTDPPYGLSFMGKKWDAETPCEQYWIEALRICKPGAMMLCFGGTRTYHRLACAIEDAGWEIRDCIMYVYGSGFPKSHNHFGFEGYGTALKPAYEPVIMAMKPLDGTFKQNAEKHGVAGINIDECRIESTLQSRRRKASNEFGQDSNWNNHANVDSFYDASKGRWPANILFDEEAAEMLDEQSGNLKSGSIEPHHKFKLEKINTFGKYHAKTGINQKGDSGGASRFFYCAKASSSERNAGLEGMPKVNKPLMGEFKNNPGRETPKSSPTPKQNFHPTVKPLKLMEYLLKLVTPPNGGIVLDPFAGSGTTLLAAKNLNINAIGIEKCPEYCQIAKGRLNVS
jgi:DNA modification methylase